MISPFNLEIIPLAQKCNECPIMTHLENLFIPIAYYEGTCSWNLLNVKCHCSNLVACDEVQILRVYNPCDHQVFHQGKTLGPFWSLNMNEHEWGI